MLKVGSKRRRTKAELENDDVVSQMKDVMTEELERETISLKKQLAEKTAEA